MNWCFVKSDLFPGTQKAASPCQTVMIFRGRNWVFPWRHNYSFLNHLSKLNCLFPFPHNCPFRLMGMEESEQRRWEFSLVDSYAGTDCGKTEQEAALLPLMCSSFFRTRLATLPFSSYRKRYIIWRSRAKYLIWMIMLQVSHQTCSAWITNYFSST